MYTDCALVVHDFSTSKQDIKFCTSAQIFKLVNYKMLWKWKKWILHIDTQVKVVFSYLNLTINSIIKWVDKDFKQIKKNNLDLMNKLLNLYSQFEWVDLITNFKFKKKNH